MTGYMSRKKYFIPKGEVVRDYHKYTSQPSVEDVVLDWEFEDGDEVFVRGRNKDSITKE